MPRKLVLLLVLALPLAATERRPLMPLDVRPAVYVQSTPDVVSDGRDFVAVWGDERAKDRPNFTRGYAVYVSPLTADGRPAYRFGLEIAPIGYDPQIEWNGRTFLVTFNQGIEAYARRIGADGVPLSAPRQIASRPVDDLASDGTTFCALSANYPDTTMILMDEDANVLRRIPVEGSGGAIVSLARSYIVFTVSGTRLLATTLAPDGSLAQKSIATVGQGTLVSAYSNGSRVLVASTSGSSADIAVLDERAVMVATPLHFGRITSYGDAEAPPSIAWDGAEFLAAWPESGSMSAVRVSNAGRAVSEEPFLLPVNAFELRSATNGSRTVLVSSEETDPVSRVMPSFGAAFPPAQVISFSGTPQSEPQVAATGNKVLAVSREGDSYGGIAASLFTTDQPGDSHIMLERQEIGVFRDGPSVAASADTFLVAWREVSDNSVRILAKRVLARGTVLDQVPIVVSDEGRAIEHFGDTAVAWNGESFLVVWHSSAGQIQARVVGRNGVPGPTATISDANGNLDRRTPAVLWNGSAYFVAWSETLPLNGPVSPQNPQRTLYRSALVSSDANVLGSPRTLFEATGYCQGLSVAASRNHILLVTTTGSYLGGADWPVHTLFLDKAGNALASAPTRIDTETPTFRRLHPATAWDGTAFVVFWNERPWLEDWSVIEGRRVAFNTAMQSLGLDRGKSFFPAAASLPEGAVLVETAALAEQSNVARLYARTFAPVRTRMRGARP
jgi:hypothetical protein